MKLWTTNQRKIAMSALALAFVATIPQARADVITWTLQNVAFSNGQTASGTIQVDSVAVSGFYPVLSYSITFSGVPSNYPQNVSGTGCAGGFGTCVQTAYYETTPVQAALLLSAFNANETSAIGFELTANLSDMFPPGEGPSTIPLLVTTPTVQESLIYEEDWNNGSFLDYASIGQLISGDIVQTVQSAPEPLSSSMLGSALVALGFFKYRRRSTPRYNGAVRRDQNAPSSFRGGSCRDAA